MQAPRMPKNTGIEIPRASFVVRSPFPPLAEGGTVLADDEPVDDVVVEVLLVVLEAEGRFDVGGVPIVAADELSRVVDDVAVGVLLVVLVAEGNADVLLGEAGVLESPAVWEVDAKLSDAGPEVGFSSEAAASVVVFTTKLAAGVPVSTSPAREAMQSIISVESGPGLYTITLPYGSTTPQQKTLTGQPILIHAV
ncbi:hypothetical protein B0A54_12905 [Friedmanniomyces endolithicus]|uniref:Uncharacterized protein n=1 Tax=Friedmanniomyces endolithicus TaxID=329885 RepID=A0A4U0ULH6_9PEZI|nr:hypothetical protein B0A54_12905 [Friedmanniomyces endolithicus]